MYYHHPSPREDTLVTGHSPRSVFQFCICLGVLLTIFILAAEIPRNENLEGASANTSAWESVSTTLYDIDLIEIVLSLIIPIFFSSRRTSQLCELLWIVKLVTNGDFLLKSCVVVELSIELLCTHVPADLRFDSSYFY
jgi:hypothetical protein